MRKRYYIKTGYHYWLLMRRHDDNMDPTRTPDSYKDTSVNSFSARDHNGDNGARAYARKACDFHNSQENAA